MNDIKIIITDDHSLFRNGVKASLQNKPAISIIAEAENGRDLLDKLESLNPDLIIMGVSMPVMDGVQTMPILRKKYPEIKVIILSMYNDPSMICRMIELGANTYLTKESGAEKIYEAIIACQQKWLYINDVVKNAIASRSFDQTSYNAKELEILNLLREKKSINEIAEGTDLSPKTIEALISKMKTKTNANSVEELLKKTKHVTNTNYIKKSLELAKRLPIKKFILFTVLALIITAVVIFGQKIYKDYEEKRKKELTEKQQAESRKQRTELEGKLATVKEWRIESQQGIGAKEIKFVTKWQNGNMYYKFHVELMDGINEIRRNRNSYNGFIINFVDKDGFKTFSFSVPLQNMTGIVDANNSTIALSINDKIGITVDQYLKLDQWQIGWNF